MNRNTVSCSAFLSRLGRLCALAVAGLFAATATADPYLTFSSAQSFTITPQEALWNGTLEYSTDATSWAVFDTAGATAADDGSGTYRLYLRGTGNTSISAATVYALGWTLTAAGTVACEGNIETLLDYAKVINGEHPVMYGYCFANLFQDWTALTEAPALPATTLADYCYSGMFQGCTGLTQPPALPATALADYCYQNMFQGCTGIKLSTQGPGAEWGIPAAATAQTGWNDLMLDDTGGTLTGNPEIGVIYYCTSAPGPDPDPDPEAPVITAITVDTGASTLEITIDNAITGAWYTLLVADELGDPWAVTPAVQATADGILVFQNVPATLPHRFYKVRASATQP